MVGVAIGLRNSPILYRSAVLRLRLAEAVVSTRLEALTNPSIERIEKLLQWEASQREIRFLLISSDGFYIFDTERGVKPELERVNLANRPNNDDPVNTLRVKDADGNSWMYILGKLPSDNYLMSSIPVPRVALRTILRDELLAPFIRAGIIAVFLVILISLWLSNWITKPLQKLAEFALRTGGGSFQEIDVGGPKEILQLSEAFNQMVRRLEISQQSQKEFLANISHELKTPLTTIQGFAQAMMDGTIDSDEERRNAAEIIINDVGRLHRLVLDLLTLTRLENGALGLSLQPCDLGELLQNIGKRIALQAEKSAINLVIDLPVLPLIMGDMEKLAQVFTNLLENSIKFTPPGGFIQVKGTETKNSVIIEVSDTGTGISVDDQKRIFERFYQADKSRKGGAERGFGLGLAIAREIVLAHQGRIWVQSNPGSGSSFYVELPIGGKPANTTT
jgi:signal transduction histidine kinase